MRPIRIPDITVCRRQWLVTSHPQSSVQYVSKKCLKSNYTSQQSHLMNVSSDCVGKWTLEMMVSKSISLPKQNTPSTQAPSPSIQWQKPRLQPAERFFAAFTETYSNKHRLKGLSWQFSVEWGKPSDRWRLTKQLNFLSSCYSCFQSSNCKAIRHTFITLCRDGIKIFQYNTIWDVTPRRMVKDLTGQVRENED